MEPAKPHVLVVDDEDSLRFLIAQHLMREGFEVETAANAEEASEKLTRTAYEAVVTDLMLPGKSGMALLEEALVRSSETIVIMMTEQATIEAAVEATKNGAYDYVNKPFKLIELPAMIRKGLNEGHLRRENQFLHDQLREKIGDIRQLQHLVERMTALSGNRTAAPFIELPEEGIDFQNVVTGMERELIRQSLRRTNGNKKLAAKLLSLKRTTLIEKIKRIGLEEQIPTPAGWNV